MKRLGKKNVLKEWLEQELLHVLLKIKRITWMLLLKRITWMLLLKMIN
jgi:hypothetical protein